MGTDQGFIAGLDLLPPNADGSKKFYMAAVSPWFFTHFGAPLNKNVRTPSPLPSASFQRTDPNLGLQFIFFADNHLYPTKWENLITDKDVAPRVDMVEIVTWNDYGESHYIGPLSSPHNDDGGSKWANDM